MTPGAKEYNTISFYELVTKIMYYTNNKTYHPEKAPAAICFSVDAVDSSRMISSNHAGVGGA